MNRLASTLFLTLVNAAPFATALANDDTALLAYAAPDGEWIRLDNGVVLEGSDLSSLDTNTTGFRLTAGFEPGWRLGGRRAHGRRQHLCQVRLHRVAW